MPQDRGLFVLGPAEPVAEDLDGLGDIAFELPLGGALEQRADPPIADLRDATRVVNLPGFPAPGRKPEVRADIPRAAEAIWFVDGRDKCECCEVADAGYLSERTRGWLKVKCTGREEFVIIGWTDPRGSRRYFGSLLLGYYDAQGQLHYAGGVGTGFSQDKLREVYGRITPLERKTSPLTTKATDLPPRPHWAEPKLVCEMRFTEYTRDRHVRHPSFLGLRDDKKAQDVVLDPEVRQLRSKRRGKLSGVCGSPLISAYTGRRSSVIAKSEVKQLPLPCSNVR